MKKLLIIGGIVVVFFVAIIALTTASNKSKLADNPYGTDDLKPSTIDLIGNENYDSIVLPDAVSKKIESGEPTTVYFFHPQCHFCMEMTPVLMPIAKEEGVKVNQYNMQEFGDEAKKAYGIQEWPALVQYENGKEVGRLVGLQPEENIHAFFNEFYGK
ncbi:thioredoxin family protein [Sporosarcina gallistercoris]|uniref:Thioredoxin family protein n=1 Tax=Sporosarcina gallistercoris TaxID=2762245 RepID=A0ABR8PLB8_9BACL|nr:thioredoxin family protein [Sporosarcina gallistercoris]MBD7908973.1 thioredoxin family protein [Sporosarcina gallistercoris]